MKKAIVTGPTGAIGHALINTLIENNVEIYAICRPNSSRIKSLPKHALLHIVEADLSELFRAVSLIPKDCDVFFHLGWVAPFGADRNNMELQTKNIQYTLDAVELAKECGCKSFVGAGSQAEYGRVEGKLKPDTPAFPENGYGMAKLCAGQMSRVKAQSFGIKHIWTRILSVYGPYDGQYTMIMSTIEKLLKGEKPALTKGEQMWDFIYAQDAGNIMYELGTEKSIDGKIYVLGSGLVRPLADYIKCLRDIVDSSLELGFGDIPYGAKQVMYLCADNTDIVNDLGYEYSYTFEKGIKETIDWFKRNII